MAQKNLPKYIETINSYSHFKVASVRPTIGLVIPSVATVFGTYPGWKYDESTSPKTLTLTGGHDESSRSALVAETVKQLREKKQSDVLEKWRNELKPAYGPSGELLFSIERSAIVLLGLVSYGIHMVAYTRSEDTGELKLWISKRSMKVAVYPGLLDNTVAGGISTGEIRCDAMVREAHEGASLPPDLVRQKVKACGTLSYLGALTSEAGGEVGLLQPDIHFLFEIELHHDVKPSPGDDEVEWYQLWDIGRIKEALAAGQFKPNFSLLIRDFFIRHGILNEQNEPDYVEISARLHRMLEFPVGGANSSSKRKESKV